MTFSSLVELSLTAGSRSPAIDFGLGHGAGGDQSSDAGLAQAVAVAAHTILQAPGLEPPLAAKPTIILGAFTFAGLGRAGDANSDGKDDEQRGVLHFVFAPPLQNCDGHGLFPARPALSN
jgi:hypothetical protein